MKMFILLVNNFKLGEFMAAEGCLWDWFEMNYDADVRL